nr:MAG TPA: hypothetical protein [Crassvirales sp.]
MVTPSDVQNQYSESRVLEPVVNRGGKDLV